MMLFTGGVHNAFSHATAMGASSFALFVKNQRTWNAKPLDEETVAKFKMELQVRWS